MWHAFDIMWLSRSTAYIQLLYRVEKKIKGTDFCENGGKLLKYSSAWGIQKKKVYKFWNAKLPRYDVRKVNWHFDLKTNKGDIRGSANYFVSESPEIDEQFAAIFRKIGAFFTPVQYEY